MARVIVLRCPTASYTCVCEWVGKCELGKMNEEGKYGVAVYTPKGEMAKQNIVASDGNYVYL